MAKVVLLNLNPGYEDRAEQHRRRHIDAGVFERLLMALKDDGCQQEPSPDPSTELLPSKSSAKHPGFSRSCRVDGPLQARDRPSRSLKHFV